MGALVRVTFQRPFPGPHSTAEALLGCEAGPQIPQGALPFPP